MAPTLPCFSGMSLFIAPAVLAMAQAVTPPGQPFPLFSRKMHIKCYLFWDSRLDGPGRQECPPLCPFRAILLLWSHHTVLSVLLLALQLN